jgi:outer membrane lipoprotein-sorting protein
MGTDAAVAQLSTRARSIHSLRATATLVLTSADNQHVTLDAAIVAQIPPVPLTSAHSAPDTQGSSLPTSVPNSPTPRSSQVSLRIRTWKFGQAIFDLTAKPEGIWIASDSKPQEQAKSDDRLKSLKPQNISDTWNLFFGDFFAAAHIADDRPPREGVLTVVHRTETTTILCDIDKQTLTARQYRILDDKGNLQQTLTLARYQEFKDATGTTLPWPMLVTASGNQGQVQLRFDEVELNPDLDAEVFTPPRRAVKTP